MHLETGELNQGRSSCLLPTLRSHVRVICAQLMLVGTLCGASPCQDGENMPSAKHDWIVRSKHLRLITKSSFGIVI